MTSMEDAMWTTFTFQLTSSRGGWHFRWYYASWTGNFNSHPHEEDDSEAIEEYREQIHFNSHPHEEDDEVKPSIILQQLHFNSHPHEEDDISRLVKQLCQGIFQLTSSRGGWQVCRRIRTLEQVFQLTSSRGGWRWNTYTLWRSGAFQLTSSRGGWLFSFSEYRYF